MATSLALIDSAPQSKTFNNICRTDKETHLVGEASDVSEILREEGVGHELAGGAAETGGGDTEEVGAGEDDHGIAHLDEVERGPLLRLAVGCQQEVTEAAASCGGKTDRLAEGAEDGRDEQTGVLGSRRSTVIVNSEIEGFIQNSGFKKIQFRFEQTYQFP